MDRGSTRFGPPLSSKVLIYGYRNFEKSETELTASVLKKDPKHTKKLKERFLIRRNRKKRANFRGNPLLQATYNTTENS